MQKNYIIFRDSLQENKSSLAVIFMPIYTKYPKTICITSADDCA